MIRAWRIVKRKHARAAFSGEGARLFGGRWNSPGNRVVYCAGSLALAALELIVHADDVSLVAQYAAFEVRIPHGLIHELDPGSLPRNWSAADPPKQLALIGDKWVENGKSAVLSVPSAVVPVERNYLLNPAHPGFAKIEIGIETRFRFDRRLIRSASSS